MDPKLFRQRLEELAELQEISVPRDAARREADEPAEVRYRGQFVTLDLKNNPTLNFRIKKIKSHEQIRCCEDCGLEVIDRRTNLRVCEFPVKHWRESCQTCQRSRHPETGEFTLTSKESVQLYKEYLIKPELRARMKPRGK